MAKEPSKLFEKKALNFLVDGPVKLRGLCFLRLTKNHLISIVKRLLVLIRIVVH